MTGLYLETCTSNLKSVALTVLEILAFCTQKFRRSRDTSHAPFRKLLRVHVRLSLETRLSNLKSIDLTVLELLAFNHPKFRWSRGPGHALFEKQLRGHVWTNRENMHVKFDVRSFNRFGAINILTPKNLGDPGHAPFSKNL